MFTPQRAAGPIQPDRPPPARVAGARTDRPTRQLEALVQMKLLSNRDKDRTHVRDLIGVGLIDRNWLGALPPVLAERLARILETPDE
jgi:hypothetical protein